MHRVLSALMGAALLVPGTALAQAASPPDDPVAEALSAAPPAVAEQAAVVDLDGNTLRTGTNGWTCVAMPGAPMCLDAQWMSWLDAYMSGSDRVETSALGLAYMLQGDTGASNIDPHAEGPTPDNEWVVTGPHLMLIVPDPALLEGIPTDPATGGPYVMWKGHPLAHVMVPVSEDGAVMHH